LITNQLDASAPHPINRYARRILIENTIVDAVNFFQQLPKRTLQGRA